MDVETSVRNSAPILIIIKNNRKFIDTDGGKSSRLARVRFGAGVDIGSLCSALGAKTYEVSDPGNLEKTLKLAISTVNKGRTAVVEVKTKRVNASLHSLWQD
jgi:thiamine pyrophosphate-dependent acetolactate synthase large subunit-like protein